MTREEAISGYIVPALKNTWNDKIKNAVIKALEQESVLDKIKEEVEQTRKMYLEMNDIDWLNGCDYVLSIIDKYRAESEVEK